MLPGGLPMTIGMKQRLFAELLGHLLNEIYERGYEVSIGDVWAKNGHMEGSMHYIKLAADLNLFKDGVYLRKTEDHKQFGEFWEGLDDLCRWGGRFKAVLDPKTGKMKGGPDGNHYSLTHGGRA